MGHYEKLWLNNYPGPKVLYYFRYVDEKKDEIWNSLDEIDEKFCYYLHFYKFYSYFNLISLSSRDEIHYYFYILFTHIIPNLYCTHIQIILLFVTRIWKPYDWHLRARN